MRYVSLKYFLLLCCFKFVEIKSDEAFRRCPSGFLGSACQHHCTYPLFGIGCKYKCKCNVQYCHHISGCSPAANCLDGYFGEYCNRQCTFPKFGYACQQTCICSKSQCNFSTGCHFEQNDLSNEKVIQTSSTMPSSTQGHTETFMQLSSVSQTQTQHSTRTRQFTISQPIGSERPKHASGVKISPSLNETSLQDSEAVNGQMYASDRKNFLVWITSSWIRICVTVFGAMLFLSITIHIFLSVINYLKERKQQIITV